MENGSFIGWNGKKMDGQVLPIHGSATYRLKLINLPWVVMRFFEAYHTVEEMKDQLMIADQIKDDFLSNTSHELRTPLNVIVNISDTLLKGVTGHIDDEQQKIWKSLLEAEGD